MFALSECKDNEYFFIMEMEDEYLRLFSIYGPEVVDYCFNSVEKLVYHHFLSQL